MTRSSQEASKSVLTPHTNAFRLAIEFLIRMINERRKEALDEV
jgi:hypothetical protein